MHKTNKTEYCPPEAEVLVVRIERAVLSDPDPVGRADYEYEDNVMEGL